MIPEFKKFILPSLQFFTDEVEHNLSECEQYIVGVLGLNDEDVAAMLPSGRARIVRNRVSWSLTYLKKAELISSPKRGVFKITSLGKELLTNSPEEITQKYLAEHYSSFKDFSIKQYGNPDSIDSANKQESELTPIDELHEAYNKINAQLAEELLKQVQAMSWQAFEVLVIKLLEAMGYGDGNSTPLSNDNGVDGIINEDKLGLGKIFIQAKHWDETVVVGAPEVQKFIGAIISQGGTKGVFVTTSKFSKAAYNLSSANIKLVLIDGQRLANLMIQYNLGVSTSYNYAIKRLDTDFFNDL